MATIPSNSTLPLVEFVRELNADISLEDICLIGVQHLLGTTHSLFHSLEQSGLAKENVHLLGKCYSANAEVSAEMVRDGINVSPFSFAFESHIPFDAQFNMIVNEFLKSAIGSVKFKNYKKIILLDDGGHLIDAAHDLDIPFEKIVGVEQTTSGYAKLKTRDLRFPVVNVARSPAKLIFETPLIAEIVIEKIIEKIKSFQNSSQKILILGGGFIGRGVYEKLHNYHSVIIYDTDPKISQLSMNEFIDSLHTFDMIIGCTGSTSLPQHLHHHLHNCNLISASSSDREFEAVHFRKKANKSHCHADIRVGGIHLINSGFPINFDGGLHSVSPEKVQLTRSLLAQGIFQASQPGLNHDFIPLDTENQREMITFFSKLNRHLGFKEDVIRKAI